MLYKISVVKSRCSHLCDDALVTSTERSARRRTPRQRARAEADAEIKRIARRQLADGGAGALSLREIAKEMGLVSSAVYRYVASRDALLTGLIADAYNRLGQAAEAADAPLDRDDTAGRWRAAACALRDWALAQPTDHTLVFGPPVPGYVAPPETYAPGQRWVDILIDIGERAACRAGAPDPPAVPPTSGLHADLQALRLRRSPDTPIASLAAGLRAWAQLHGLVALEIHGQTAFVLDGGAPEFFRHCVEQQVLELGLRSPDYPDPA